MIEQALFCVFAATALLSASTLLWLRDPVKLAIALVGCFFSIACLYLLQAAELIAVLEVLVYAGAIMVLFVFVIMLVEQKDEAIWPSGLLPRIMLPVKCLAVGIVAANMLVVVWNHLYGVPARLAEGFGSPRAIGKLFFSDFLFQFEVTSVLLLVAIVGAMIISKEQAEERR